MVTGEWYIPGHKLRGFRVESVTDGAGVTSNGEAKVETTGMHFGEFDFIFPPNLLKWNWIEQGSEKLSRFWKREDGESFRGRPLVDLLP